MNCHVEREWHRPLVKVWFWHRDGMKGSLYLKLNSSDERELVEIPEGAEVPEPTLVLHEQEVKSLLEALADFDLPGPAMAAHLKDAVGVRDRLLSMLEVYHQPQVFHPQRTTE